MYRYISKVAPMLRPIVARDSVKDFYQLYTGWSHFMGIKNFLYPEILCSMVSSDSLRCARAVLEGHAPLKGRRADPSGRHRYGFTALHMAAETFSVDMVKLLFRHGASANVRTEGEHVIQGLLPLHVAVKNASMHKYLEDNWDNGDPVDNLIFLLSLPEMVCSLHPKVPTTVLFQTAFGHFIIYVYRLLNSKFHVLLCQFLVCIHACMMSH